MRADIRTVRRLLWHLRAGGPQQVRTWLAREAFEAGHRKLETVRGAEGVWVGRGRKKRLKFRPTGILPARQQANGLPRVGVVLDEFSALAFGVEWDCVQLSPKSWREQLTKHAVDVVFVESAWKGLDGLWAGKIAGQDHSGPSTLRELTDWCRDQSIPTAFWNKEDPPHYSDFLSAAKLFDFVFTSDANRIETYLNDLNHDRVDVLSFAAQPAIHNPVRPKFGWHERDVAFAGMYFAEKYPERRQQLDILLEAAEAASSAMETGLEIFSRQLGGDPRYQFPAPFDGRVVGSLEYPEMLTAYKAYKTFLNVNSVLDSPTMCSRRVFEIIASGSNVVTTPSAAIGSHFAADEIFTVGNVTEAEQLLRALHRNPELGERQLHRGQRRVWREHTYRARSNQILAAVAPQLALPPVRPTVSLLVSTIRPWQLEHVFQSVGSQRDVDGELVLLTHGFTVEDAKIRQLKEQYGVSAVTLLTAETQVTLGECLNLCVSAAGGQVLTKMDDDDFYAANYLSDQLHALEYSGADVVGKQAHYMYLAGQNATLLRFPEWEHRYTRTVMGPTIMGFADVFRSSPFPAVSSGEDTRFLRDVGAAGGVIYASDRFNYCQQRAAEGHTWDITDAELLASGELKFFGNYRDQVSV
ncbi:glycosyltransferase [Pseudarthrobacter sp. PH31-O2]|uniref:glycosyltransferase n=1 Tax=Pseudarthrobacter sp. PH31-O2 TaxID=3046206 RepID=UPI0024BAF3DD|nr:glycosyltransferase [Pseudarthrobacter sp. PH31-O2]MDJ0351360.1 glycosyltransferase [Pseudarthrobacter sp. PH31-O2]